MKLVSFWTDTAASFAGRTQALPERVDVAVVGRWAGRVGYSFAEHVWLEA